MAVQVAPAGSSQLTPVAGFGVLLESAEAVAAVEVLRVDESATPADGPLILDVKVLAVAKGAVSVGEALRTWEAPQVAGVYRAGERRLLLLKRQHPIEAYHRKAAWWIIPTSLAVFVEDGSLDQITLDALRKWLHGLTTRRDAAPRVDIRRHGRSDDALELTVTLANTSRQAIRLKPSCVTASFDAAQRRFIPPIAWETSVAGGWFLLEPGTQLSGAISVAVRLPENMTTLPVMLGHSCLGVPLPHTWIGHLTAEVAL
jgi:hypothetical protein